jgi:uncharacterized protein
MSEAVLSPIESVQTNPPPALPPARGRRPLAEFAIDVIIAITVTFAMSMFAGVLWGMARGFALAMGGLDRAKMDPATIAARLGQPGILFQIGATALSLGTAALILVLWRRRPTAEERARSRAASRRGTTWAMAVGTGVATTLSVMALTSVAQAGGVDMTPSNEAIIRALMVQSPWLLIPFAAGLAPLYEEVLFRRVFYGRLLAAGRPRLALVLSAGLFASVHEVPGFGGDPWPMTLALWVVYAGLGMVFALLYRRCGTLWAPIAAHATHNLLACVLLLNELG